MLLRWVAVTLALAASAGCGARSDDAERQGPSRAEASATTASAAWAPTPHRALRRCAELAPRRSIPVLCPAQLPRARWFVRYQTLHAGRDAYLTDLETRPFGSGQAFHVLAGGRRGPWPLRTAHGQWPLDTALRRDLSLLPVGSLQPGEGAEDLERGRIRLVRAATVDGHPALLLETAEYPAGASTAGTSWSSGTRAATATRCRCTSPTTRRGAPSSASGCCCRPRAG